MEIGGTRLFWALKRGGDIVLSLSLMPVLILTALALVFLNTAYNPGPLFFCQSRIGRGGKAFVMVKFRTMHERPKATRFADTEAGRIPALGRFLRRFRLDELPQILHVLRGQMSLIGPRPEQPEFVREFRTALAGYDLRHCIRPGLSGLSQVTIGYAADTHATRRKLALDLRYIRRSGFRLECYILWRTCITIATGRGAL